MLPTGQHQRRAWQFGLRGLLAAIAVLALPLVVAHYCLARPELFALFAGLAVAIAMYCLVIVAPLIGILWLAEWNTASRITTEIERETMRRIGRWFFGVVAFGGLLLLPAVVLGVWADYRDSLPNGYRIVYGAANRAAIVAATSRGRTVVGPHVAEWTVQNQYVWGRGLDLSDAPNENAWFLLDTSSGEVGYYDDFDQAMNALGKKP